MKIIHIIFFLLSFIGPSVYCMDCPGHPRDVEEIQREYDDERYEYDKEILDIIDPENAPHTTEDAKNFAQK